MKFIKWLIYDSIPSAVILTALFCILLIKSIINGISISRLFLVIIGMAIPIVLLSYWSDLVARRIYRGPYSRILYWCYSIVSCIIVLGIFILWGKACGLSNYEIQRLDEEIECMEPKW